MNKQDVIAQAKMIRQAKIEYGAEHSCTLALFDDLLDLIDPSPKPVTFKYEFAIATRDGKSYPVTRMIGSSTIAFHGDHLVSSCFQSILQLEASGWKLSPWTIVTASNCHVQ